MENLYFKKQAPFAHIPSYAKAGDAGLDLICTRVEWEGDLLVYHTDLAVEIPEGYAGFLMPRSSICRVDLALTNSVGLIDSGYRGELMAKFRITKENPRTYQVGEK